MRTLNRPVIQTVIGVLILLGFAVFIQAFIGWGTLLKSWTTLNPTLLAAPIILVFLTYSLRAWRVYDYFSPQLSGQFGLCLHLSLQHNMMNNLLPMRTGEISFPVLMSRYFAIPTSHSLPTLFWFRLLDFHTLILLALLFAGAELLGPLYATITTGIFLLVPWIGFRLYRPAIKHLETRSGGTWQLLQHILSCFPQSSAKFWRSWLLTLVNWMLKLAVFAWVLSLFIDISLGAAWLGVTGGDLTSVLPIHGVAGAGTYEAGVVAALIPFKVPPAEALAAAVNLHLFILGCTIISGLISLVLPKTTH